MSQTLQKTTEVYVIRIYPSFREGAPELFLNAEAMLIFETKPQAWQYAQKIEDETQFWAYTIEKRYFVSKDVKI